MPAYHSLSPEMNDEPTFFEPQDWSIIKTSSLLMNDSLSLYDDTAMFNPQEPPVDFGPSYEPPKIKTEPLELVPNDGHSYSDWQSKYIDHWTPQDCLYWLIHQLQDLKVGQGLPEFKLERVAHIDGPTLRQMSVDDFNCIFPEHGLELYNRMHLFKGTFIYSHSLHSFDQWSGNVSGSGQEYSHPHPHPHPHTRYPHPHSQTETHTFKTEPRTLTDLDTEPSRSPRYPVPSYCSPSESDSGYKSDSSETTIVEQPPPPEKRRPGRPRGSKRKKKPEKLGRLWEFIRDLLLNPMYNPSLICWENYEEGTFRFVHSDRVAKLWGSKKDNIDMNYEKLSRAMRYYYKSQVLLPVYGKRLVYKFGPTATGWRSERPIFRQG